ncbi:trace amine-associated receptor 13c-like [Acanthopagrus latus]|uniref:trace amine-associated receptor 13c-like n=1 Tax=Acanthopagrus latus TaxID=8177 RepID=UPI00187C9012|nr:trace amine-associated receptor 13c-like [Acanthopagrus latus]
MIHESLPPEWLMYCAPGSNATCVALRLGLWIDFALYLVFVSGMLVTILGNSLVILSICHFKQLHTPTNVLILSLALVDLLVGVIVMPFSATRTVHGCWFYGDTFCHLHFSFEVFLTTLSIFHLICIAVDRHQAICNPLHYSRKITMSVAVMMVCVSWALAAVYAYGGLYSKVNEIGIEDVESYLCTGGCIILSNPLWDMLTSALCVFFPCTVMVCLYAKIFVVAKQHVRKIGDKNNYLNDRGRVGLVKKSESKAAKTLSIVLGVFIFCCVPLYLLYLIDSLTSWSIPPLLDEVFYWMNYFNSACNPIIYALFHPSFKKCFHHIITLKVFTSHSSNMNCSEKIIHLSIEKKSTV